MSKIADLFAQELKPINLGLETFAESMAAQGVDVTAVDWQPPVDGYVELDVLQGADVDAANAEAVRRITAGRPLLVGMGLARDVIPGFHDRLITHSGPPITWERMSGPTRGAVIGALLYEGLAETPEAAAELAGSGAIEFAPCHHYHAVGPMAGIISPSMPVFIVRNDAFGNLAYATQNEGLGRVLRYGAYGPEVIQRLHWMDAVLYPALQRALGKTGPIDLRSMIAQALHMGDECHNRNKAGTSLFIRALGPALAETSDWRHRGRRAALHRRQRSFLPQPLHAGHEGHAAAGREHPRLHRGDGHGPQRHRLGHPRQRHRRALVHRARAHGRGAVAARLQSGGRQPRHRRQRHHRDRRHRRLRPGRRAGHRPVRGRHAAGRAQHHPGHVRDHGRRA